MRRIWLVVAIMVAVGACSPSKPAQQAQPTPSVSVPTATPTSSTVRFAAVGDIGDGSNRPALVANAILAGHRERPLDLILLLGDIIYPDGDVAEIAKFREPYAPLIAEDLEMHVALGNHDIQTDRDAFMDAFDMPARWYTFVRGPVQFFALDSSRGVIEGAQRSWLDRALARSRARWKVVFMHVPMFSSGIHGNNLALQQALQPLFDRYDVSLALAGHDHNYERTQPILGTVYVVSGGGCCPRSTGSQSFTARALTGLHFVVVEAGEDALHIEAFDPEGKSLDRVTLT